MTPEAGVDPAQATLACEASNGSDEDLAQEIVGIAESYMADNDLRSVTLSVKRGDENLVTAVMGTSIDGVPADTSMRFYNGAVMFSYMGTAVLSMAADGLIDIDEPVERWVDGVPGGDQITTRMLMASMSGLADFVPMKEWIDELYENPFRPFTTEELEKLVYAQPLAFTPGTNVAYTHLGFRLAGEVMEAAAGKPLPEILDERVVEPLGLDATEFTETVQFDGPVLRTYTDERGMYEESTGWSPAWGVPVGGTQVTNICDLVRSAEGIGSGELLDDEQLRTLLDPAPEVQGQRDDSCVQCIPTDENLHLGLGVTVAGDWVIQTPLFTGIAAVQAYLPPQGDDEAISIAVSNTYGPNGDVSTNGSTAIMVQIAELLAPATPLPPQIG
ncbi:MAG: serine hydrolase domain-containing protein [Microthrixaceae bacterium]